VTKSIIMFFRSYLTQLCRKRVIKTWTNERKTKRGATCKFCSATVIPAKHNIFHPGDNYKSSDLFDQNLSLWRENPAWQDVARATNCRHGGNEVPEPMFSKIICRHGDKCPAWREKVVWGKWMMTWQKPTGKESSCRPSNKILPGGKALFSRSIKAILLISKTLWSDLRSFLGEEKQGKLRETLKEQGAQGLKGFTRSLRHHGLLPFHLFFSPCKVTMTMSS